MGHAAEDGTVHCGCRGESLGGDHVTAGGQEVDPAGRRGNTCYRRGHAQSSEMITPWKRICCRSITRITRGEKAAR